VSARAAGVLLHPTSLPGRFGIGDLGPAAIAFLDFLRQAEQTVWQILPLGPTGAYDSPYNCLSAFAGNPLLISPEVLVADGFLPATSLQGAPRFVDGVVDYQDVRAHREALLLEAWQLFQSAATPAQRQALQEFRESPDQRLWLDDWALFAALAARERTADWSAWDLDVVHRNEAALQAARGRLEDAIAFQTFVQHLFFSQWKRLREAAAGRGIQIMGDIPIYVAYGSADVWAHQRLFHLDEDGRPTVVAGVPPDYFSETGQLWGNPLYRWDVLAEDGYGWWVERMRASFRLFDLVRVDHFRAFASYWEVPADHRTALNGVWRKGPGAAFFEALRGELGELPIVAEDLGLIDEEVRELLAATGFPGMKVLQFGFYEEDGAHLPHNHGTHAVVYTGTHDNDTARGWWARLKEEERVRVHDYLGGDGSVIERDLARAAYTSPAERAIVPAQDLLGLGSEAAMNQPGRAAGNWRWRLTDGQLRPILAKRLARLARLTGRAPQRSLE